MLEHEVHAGSTPFLGATMHQGRSLGLEHLSFYVCSPFPHLLLPRRTGGLQVLS